MTMRTKKALLWRTRGLSQRRQTDTCQDDSSQTAFGLRTFWMHAIRPQSILYSASPVPNQIAVPTRLVLAASGIGSTNLPPEVNQLVSSGRTSDLLSPLLVRYVQSVSMSASKHRHPRVRIRFDKISCLMSKYLKSNHGIRCAERSPGSHRFGCQRSHWCRCRTASESRFQAMMGLDGLTTCFGTP